MRALRPAGCPVAWLAEHVRAVQLRKFQEQVGDDYLLLVARRQQRLAMLRANVGSKVELEPSFFTQPRERRSELLLFRRILI